MAARDERGRRKPSPVSRTEFDRQRNQLDKTADRLDSVEKQIRCVGQLAVQTANDFATHKAALQVVFFLAGGAKQTCLHLLENYNAEKEAVRTGVQKGVPHLRSSCILYTQILHLVAEQSKPPRPPLPLYKSYVRLKLATPCRVCQTPPVYLKVIPHGLWLLNLPPQSPDDNSAPHGLTPICLALSPKMQMENGLRWDANWDNPCQSPAKNLASNPKERAKADGYPQKNAGTVQEGKGTAVATGPESLKVWTVDT